MDGRVKAEIVRVAHALHARGFVANHDGNVSARVGPDRVWTTPTSMSKADVTEESLVLVDLAGARIAGRLKAPSEVGLHLACYRAREDVLAVVHAHPPVATAFACAGVELPDAMMPEAIVSLGARIPTVPYAAPGAKAADALSPLLATYDALLLASHGAITVGVDLEQAYLRLELVEHYARIAKAARELGGARPLPSTDVAKLLEARTRAGLGPEARTAKSTSTRSAPASEPRASTVANPPQDLARVVAQEITRALRGS
jgi:L-fuculose-phosphate aldolase